MHIETIPGPATGQPQTSGEAQAYLDAHRERLHTELMARLRASVHAHRCYTTSRRDDPLPVDPQASMQTRILRKNQHFSVELWTLMTGQCMPWPAGTLAMEVLVVHGELRHCTAPELPSVGDHGYLVCDQALNEQAWVTAAPTTVYVRRRLAPLQDLAPLEAHWWQLAAVQRAAMKPKRWVPTTPGVSVTALCGDSQVVSMLVRFEPAASVVDHHHAIDEDCLVLEGDMYLGDILLRTGDFQLAPAGSSHVGEMSDGGVTFYFHGALDPVFVGTSLRVWPPERASGPSASG